MTEALLNMMMAVPVILFISLSVALGEELVYNVTEEMDNRTFVGNVAQDAKISNQNVMFSLLQSGYPFAQKFTISENLGELYTKESLDRDKLCDFQEECVLNLAVVANSNEGDFYKIKLYINVIDINDNAPKFPKSIVNIEILEDAAINTTFSLEGAVDIDTGINSVQRYEVQTHDSPFLAIVDNFADGRSMLKLVLTQTLDRESQATHRIQVLAYDGGNTPKTGSLFVNISVTDVNDNYPQFTKSSYNVTIKDDLPVDSLVVATSAFDYDEGLNGEVEYKFSLLQSEEVFQTFYINSTSGEIFLKRSLISGSKENYKIIIETNDKAKQPLISKSKVFVKVQDNHNNFPVININFLSNTDPAEVSEHARQGTVVAHIAAKDPDTGANGLVTCDVISDDFRIQKFEENVYKVVVFASLNRELKDRYEVTVRCKDAGDPPRVAFSKFDVIVKDENDNAPRFTQQTYYCHVFENNEIGINILNVSAVDSDLDINADVKYSISSEVSEKVIINEMNGNVILNTTIDREQQPRFSFYVYATDSGSIPMTGTSTVIIIVKDKNDNAPSYYKPVIYFEIKENLPPVQEIGAIHARDLDEGKNSEMAHYINDIPDAEQFPFKLNKDGKLLVTGSLDREKMAIYKFPVMAMDNGDPPLKGYAKIQINVLDINDNNPYFTFPSEINRSISIPLSTSLNTVVTTLSANDRDIGKNAKLRFYTNDRNMSDMFIINSANGDVVLTRSLDAEDLGLHVYLITVEDSGQPARATSETLLINILSDPVVDEQNFSRYYVIVISMSTVTIVLAIVIIIAIYLLRRVDNKRKRLNSSSTTAPIADKDGEEAGFSEPIPPLNKEVYYPPGYDVGSRQFFSIDRSISLQVPPTIPETEVVLKVPSDPTLWEGTESQLNENERNRNQLMTLQYHQSLMRIQSVKRTNSVLTI